MKSPRIVTLFSDQPASNWRRSSIPASILLHGLIFALLVLALSHTPHTVDQPAAGRYTVRLMNLEKPEPVPVRRRSSGGGLTSPAPAQRGQGDQKGARKGTQKTAEKTAPNNAQAAPHPDTPEGGAAAPPIALQAARLPTLHRTLVQPDVPPNLPRIKENLLPRILMWSADPSSPRKIVPPPPREVTAWSNVQPILNAPNHETKLADIRIAASAFNSPKLPSLPPSTTAPVVAARPQAAPQVPQTASKSAAVPTPARVISLSELQVQTGVVALPLVNEVAPATASNLLTGLPSSTAKEGKGSTVGSQNGGGAGQKTGGNGKQVATAGTSSHIGAGAGSAGNAGSGNATGGKSGPGRTGASTGGPGTSGSGTTGSGTTGSGTTGSGTTGSGTAGSGTSGSGAGGAGTGTGTGGTGNGSGGSGGNGTGGDGSGLGSGAGGNDLAFDRVNLPKDGQFGVVVAGSQSLADRYPEVAGVWIGRLAYTVYLHVGLSKSWILQYSLPRDAEASVVNNAVRPDAPWPYTIVRPHLAPGDLNADAVLVHGFVNSSGRFEQLKVVFPEEFSQTKFVLASLEQWQFRPARQNGRIAPVEVLLIIPDQPE